MVGKDKVIKFREEFGMAVRRRRHKLKLSQEEFAEAAGIHRTYISSIELGKVDIGISVAYKLCEALHLRLSKLLKDIEPRIKS